VVGQQSLHLLVVGQVIESVSPLCSFQVGMRLVPVQMAMANSMVLEGAVSESTDNSETFCGSFDCLELDFPFALLQCALSSHCAHLQTEVPGAGLGKAGSVLIGWDHFGHQLRLVHKRILVKPHEGSAWDAYHGHFHWHHHGHGKLRLSGHEGEKSSSLSMQATASSESLEGGHPHSW
jgi:hypothetical protein